MSWRFQNRDWMLQLQLLFFSHSILLWTSSRLNIFPPFLVQGLHGNNGYSVLQNCTTRSGWCIAWWRIAVINIDKAVFGGCRKNRILFCFAALFVILILPSGKYGCFCVEHYCFLELDLFILYCQLDVLLFSLFFCNFFSCYGLDLNWNIRF